MFLFKVYECSGAIDMFVKKKFLIEQPFNGYQHREYNQGLENLNDNFQFFILALDYRQICSHLFILRTLKIFKKIE